MAKRLEKELERGKAQFRVSGIVTVKDNTFPEKDEDGNLKETVSEKTGFSYMRAGFFIKANESQSAFVSLLVPALQAPRRPRLRRGAVEGCARRPHGGRARTRHPEVT